MGILFSLGPIVAGGDIVAQLPLYIHIVCFYWLFILYIVLFIYMMAYTRGYGVDIKHFLSATLPHSTLSLTSPIHHSKLQDSLYFAAICLNSPNTSKGSETHTTLG